jgi:ABC-type branched-subunit amino acid transport system permease subunit
VVAGLIGILASPLIQLSSSAYTFGFLVPALGAALIGRFRHFWPTFATAMVIGMVQSTFTKLQNDLSWFPKYGAREGLPFLVIIATMVFLGERLPGRGNTEATKLPKVPDARITPMSVLLPCTAAVGGIFLLGPLWRAAIMTTLIAAVLALSVVVLTGFAGQTSLSQLAFAGIAGFALSKLATHWHVPFPLAPVLAVVGAGLFGTFVVGLPALRVRGTNLAIVTLAGGVAIAEFVFKNPSFVGSAKTGGAQINNPKLGPWDFGLILGTKSSRPAFALFLLVVLVGTALVVANLRRSATGRRFLAIRSNERAAAAAAINVARGKLLAFGISSFIAGMAGTLIGYRFGSVSDVSYGTVASLTALAVAYLGGITSVSGAITSGIVAASGVAFFATSRVVHSLGRWEALIGGVLLIFTAIQNPEGIAGAIRSQADAARLKRSSHGASTDVGRELTSHAAAS